jgi:hypothetical protein
VALSDDYKYLDDVVWRDYNFSKSPNVFRIAVKVDLADICVLPLDNWIMAEGKYDVMTRRFEAKDYGTVDIVYRRAY